MFGICFGVLFVPCSHLVTSWERAGLLVLVCVVFSFVFVNFPLCVLIHFRTKDEVVSGSDV